MKSALTFRVALFIAGISGMATKLALREELNRFGLHPMKIKAE